MSSSTISSVQPRHHRRRHARLEVITQHDSARPLDRSLHGGELLTLTQALTENCDTVFYYFAAKFWQQFRKDGVEVLQDYARKFGFGTKTGIEVPFEKAGRVADEEWLHEMNARYPKAFPYKVWLPGYTINMSIGQGDLLATPLQLATTYGAIANGGTLWHPHVGMRIQEGSRVVTIPSKETGKLPPAHAALDPIRRGLERVVQPGGTAVGAFAGFPLDRFPIAAKTGTAEINGSSPSPGSQPTGLPPTRSMSWLSWWRRAATVVKWRRRLPAESSTACSICPSPTFVLRPKRIDWLTHSIHPGTAAWEGFGR